MISNSIPRRLAGAALAMALLVGMPASARPIDRTRLDPVRSKITAGLSALDALEFARLLPSDQEEVVSALRDFVVALPPTFREPESQRGAVPTPPAPRTSAWWRWLIGEAWADRPGTSKVPREETACFLGGWPPLGPDPAACGKGTFSGDEFYQKRLGASCPVKGQILCNPLLFGPALCIGGKDLQDSTPACSAAMDQQCKGVVREVCVAERVLSFVKAVPEDSLRIFDALKRAVTATCRDTSSTTPLATRVACLNVLDRLELVSQSMIFVKDLCASDPEAAFCKLEFDYSQWVVEHDPDGNLEVLRAIEGASVIKRGLEHLSPALACSVTDLPPDDSVDFKTRLRTGKASKRVLAELLALAQNQKRGGLDKLTLAQKALLGSTPGTVAVPPRPVKPPELRKNMATYEAFRRKYFLKSVQERAVKEGRALTEVEALKEADTELARLSYAQYFLAVTESYRKLQEARAARARTKAFADAFAEEIGLTFSMTPEEIIRYGGRNGSASVASIKSWTEIIKRNGCIDWLRRGEIPEEKFPYDATEEAEPDPDVRAQMRAGRVYQFCSAKIDDILTAANEYHRHGGNLPRRIKEDYLRSPKTMLAAFRRAYGLNADEAKYAAVLATRAEVEAVAERLAVAYSAIPDSELPEYVKRGFTAFKFEPPEEGKPIGPPALVAQLSVNSITQVRADLAKRGLTAETVTADLSRIDPMAGLSVEELSESYRALSDEDRTALRTGLRAWIRDHPKQAMPDLSTMEGRIAWSTTISQITGGRFALLPTVIKSAYADAFLWEVFNSQKGTGQNEGVQFRVDRHGVESVLRTCPGGDQKECLTRIWRVMSDSYVAQIQASGGKRSYVDEEQGKRNRLAALGNETVPELRLRNFLENHDALMAQAGPEIQKSLAKVRKLCVENLVKNFGKKRELAEFTCKSDATLRDALYDEALQDLLVRRPDLADVAFGLQVIQHYPQAIDRLPIQFYAGSTTGDGALREGDASDTGRAPRIPPCITDGSGRCDREREARFRAWALANNLNPTQQRSVDLWVSCGQQGTEKIAERGCPELADRQPLGGKVIPADTEQARQAAWDYVNSSPLAKGKKFFGSELSEAERAKPRREVLLAALRKQLGFQDSTPMSESMLRSLLADGKTGAPLTEAEIDEVADRVKAGQVVTLHFSRKAIERLQQDDYFTLQTQRSGGKVTELAAALQTTFGVIADRYEAGDWKTLLGLAVACMPQGGSGLCVPDFSRPEALGLAIDWASLERYADVRLNEDRATALNARQALAKGLTGIFVWAAVKIDETGVEQFFASKSDVYASYRAAVTATVSGFPQYANAFLHDPALARRYMALNESMRKQFLLWMSTEPKDVEILRQVHGGRTDEENWARERKHPKLMQMREGLERTRFVTELVGSTPLLIVGGGVVSGGLRAAGGLLMRGGSRLLVAGGAEVALSTTASGVLNYSGGVLLGSLAGAPIMMMMPHGYALDPKTGNVDFGVRTDQVDADGVPIYRPETTSETLHRGVTGAVFGGVTSAASGALGLLVRRGTQALLGEAGAAYSQEVSGLMAKFGGRGGSQEQLAAALSGASRRFVEGVGGRLQGRLAQLGELEAKLAGATGPAADVTRKLLVHSREALARRLKEMVGPLAAGDLPAALAGRLDAIMSQLQKGASPSSKELQELVASLSAQGSPAVRRALLATIHSWVFDVSFSTVSAMSVNYGYLWLEGKVTGHEGGDFERLVMVIHGGLIHFGGEVGRKTSGGAAASSRSVLTDPVTLDGPGGPRVLRGEIRPDGHAVIVEVQPLQQVPAPKVLPRTRKGEPKPVYWVSEKGLVSGKSKVRPAVEGDILTTPEGPRVVVKEPVDKKLDLRKIPPVKPEVVAVIDQGFGAISGNRLIVSDPANPGSEPVRRIVPRDAPEAPAAPRPGLAAQVRRTWTDRVESARTVLDLAASKQGRSLLWAWVRGKSGESRFTAAQGRVRRIAAEIALLDQALALLNPRSWEAQRLQGVRALQIEALRASAGVAEQTAAAFPAARRLLHQSPLTAAEKALVAEAELRATVDRWVGGELDAARVERFARLADSPGLAAALREFAQKAPPLSEARRAELAQRLMRELVVAREKLAKLLPQVDLLSSGAPRTPEMETLIQDALWLGLPPERLPPALAEALRARELLPEDVVATALGALSERLLSEQVERDLLEVSRRVGDPRSARLAPSAESLGVAPEVLAAAINELRASGAGDQSASPNLTALRARLSERRQAEGYVQSLRARVAVRASGVLPGEQLSVAGKSPYDPVLEAISLEFAREGFDFKVSVDELRFLEPSAQIAPAHEAHAQRFSEWLWNASQRRGPKTPPVFEAVPVAEPVGKSSQGTGSRSKAEPAPPPSEVEPPNLAFDLFLETTRTFEALPRIIQLRRQLAEGMRLQSIDMQRVAASALAVELIRFNAQQEARFGSEPRLVEARVQRESEKVFDEIMGRMMRGEPENSAQIQKLNRRFLELREKLRAAQSLQDHTFETRYRDERIQLQRRLTELQSPPRTGGNVETRVRELIRAIDTPVDGSPKPIAVDPGPPVRGLVPLTEGLELPIGVSVQDMEGIVRQFGSPGGGWDGVGALVLYGSRTNLNGGHRPTTASDLDVMPVYVDGDATTRVLESVERRDGWNEGLARIDGAVKIGVDIPSGLSATNAFTEPSFLNPEPSPARELELIRQAESDVQNRLRPALQEKLGRPPTELEVRQLLKEHLNELLPPAARRDAVILVRRSFYETPAGKEFVQQLRERGYSRISVVDGGEIAPESIAPRPKPKSTRAPNPDPRDPITLERLERLVTTGDAVPGVDRALVQRGLAELQANPAMRTSFLESFAGLGARDLATVTRTLEQLGRTLDPAATRVPATSEEALPSGSVDRRSPDQEGVRAYIADNPRPTALLSSFEKIAADNVARQAVNRRGRQALTLTFTTQFKKLKGVNDRILGSQAMADASAFNYNRRFLEHIRSQLGPRADLRAAFNRSLVGISGEYGGVKGLELSFDKLALGSDHLAIARLVNDAHRVAEAGQRAEIRAEGSAHQLLAPGVDSVGWRATGWATGRSNAREAPTAKQLADIVVRLNDPTAREFSTAKPKIALKLRESDRLRIAAIEAFKRVDGAARGRDLLSVLTAKRIVESEPAVPSAAVFEILRKNKVMENEGATATKYVADRLEQRFGIQVTTGEARTLIDYFEGVDLIILSPDEPLFIGVKPEKRADESLFLRDHVRLGAKNAVVVAREGALKVAEERAGDPRDLVDRVLGSVKETPDQPSDATRGMTVANAKSKTALEGLGGNLRLGGSGDDAFTTASSRDATRPAPGSQPQDVALYLQSILAQGSDPSGERLAVIPPSDAAGKPISSVEAYSLGEGLHGLEKSLRQKLEAAGAGRASAVTALGLWYQPSGKGAGKGRLVIVAANGARGINDPKLVQALVSETRKLLATPEFQRFSQATVEVLPAESVAVPTTARAPSNLTQSRVPMDPVALEKAHPELPWARLAAEGKAETVRHLLEEVGSRGDAGELRSYKDALIRREGKACGL